MELIAEEQVGFVAANAEQPASFRSSTEIDAADQPEGFTALAFQDRRDRQEELIDAIAAHDFSEELWTAFGKDGAVAVGAQRIEDIVNVDRVGVGNGSHVGGTA